jgi:hypothetical protein
MRPLSIVAMASATPIIVFVGVPLVLFVLLPAFLFVVLPVVIVLSARKAANLVRWIANENHAIEKHTNERKAFGPQFFTNSDGLHIFWRRWLPVMTAEVEARSLWSLSPRAATPSVRGIVVLVHGFGEHSGRYEHVARALTDAGLAVYACDHQGHGASEGDRAYVKRFANFSDDLLQV